MNNVANKANNTSGALGQLDAVNDWDPISLENNNAVTSSGQQLTSALSTQLAIAQNINGCAAETFTENSPGANVANLTPLTGASGLQMPINSAAAGGDAYALMNGYIVSFYHANVSTTNSTTGFTVQIGQTIASYLTGKYLVLIGGGAIPVGAIFGYTRIRYNTSAGYWELLTSDGYSKYNQQNPTNYYMNGTFQVAQVAASYADAALPVATKNYIFDRHNWYCNDKKGITLSCSQQKLAPGTADELVLLNEGCQTYGRFGASGPGTAPATSDYSRIQQYIEHGAVLLGGGRYVTITFKARASVTGKKLGVAGEQYYGTGGSPSSNTVLQGSVVTLTTSFAQYSLTLTSTSLSGITFGNNYTPTDDALIIDFFQMWGATTGSTYMGSGVAETFSPSGACNIDITEIRVTPTYFPLPFMPISYEDDLKECQRYKFVPRIDYVRSNISQWDTNNLLFVFVPKSTLRPTTLVLTAGTETTDWNVYNQQTGGTVTGFTLTISNNYNGSFIINANKTSHGLTNSVEVLFILTNNIWVNADF